MSTLAILLILLAAGPAAGAGAGPAPADWPSFRGPGGTGLGAGDPPQRFDVKTGENVRWKTPLPGLAHSSPIVSGERIFVTTAVSRKTATPELKTGWVGGSGDSAVETEPWTWKV